ncbi:MAG TPA: Ig-like domain-containing protein [Vicinamibacterales bacterium]|nr:Ig-like domain-containing protein [Vicinamibacterales bacterium]
MKWNPVGVIALLVTLFAPAPLWAQLPTQDLLPQGPMQTKHPVKTFYNSPAEWPLWDGQVHWCPGGAVKDGIGVPCIPGTPSDSGEPARFSHNHLGCQFPAYGFITGPIRIRCRLMSFQQAGRVDRMDIGIPGPFGGPAALEPVGNVVWDETGTHLSPPLIGDPSGLRSWTFTVYLDPANWWIKHGSTVVAVSLSVRFDNGDEAMLQNQLPFWTATDTSVAPFLTPNICAFQDPDYQLWPMTVDIFSASSRGESPDSQIIRICGFLPLPGQVLTAPWRIHTENGRYGRRDMTPKIPAGFSEMRVDVNLHSYDEGQLIDRVESPAGADGPVVTVHDFIIDPAQFGPGRHMTMIRWGLPLPQSDVFAGNEEVQALLTFPVDIAGDAPQPVDSDGDGILDGNDHCPGTPPGTMVDSMGCPASGHNMAPTVTAATDATTYTAPASVAITAAASDSDGNVTRVDFFGDGALLFSDFGAPYAFTWTNVGAGAHTVTAVAVDDDGASTTSAAVSITVHGSTVDGGTNVALAANGGVASASTTHSDGYHPAGANNGDRRGQPWGAGGGWNDGTPDAFPDAFEIRFNGAKTISEIDVFSVQDNYVSPAEPTPSMTFTLYGLTTFDVQYWTGSAWQTVPGGAIADNNLVWRKVTFSPLTTDRIRVLVHSALNTWSRLTEVEAYGTSTGGANSAPTVSLSAPAEGAEFTMPALVNLAATAADSDGTIARVDFFADQTLLFSDFAAPYAFTWTNATAGSHVITAVAVDDDAASTTSAARTIVVNPPGAVTNVALATNGAIATASSTHSDGYMPAGAIDGDRRGDQWGSGGGWNDGTPDVFPDSFEIHFGGTKTITEVDVFSVQDDYRSPSEPTETMTFTLYGLRTFDVQYWTGSAWIMFPGGTIVDNDLVWRKLTFAPVVTDRIRIVVHQALNTWSRIAEVEVYGTSSAPTLVANDPSEAPRPVEGVDDGLPPETVAGLTARRSPPPLELRTRRTVLP